ncbi:MAG: ATP-dependent helicase [Verrucomicrobia bacterium]|nr:MAG: ATP-dependent helicase [Verrucomicrobiota bacterium]
MSEDPTTTLRLLLPPNFERVAERDAIPVKLELIRGFGAKIRPETADESVLAGLEDQERTAAFIISSWCGGKPSSFLQLTRDQLSRLVTTLQEREAFFWVSKPTTPIPWQSGALVGVSNCLASADPPQTTAEMIREPEEPPSTAPSRTVDSDESGDPPLVDGSEHFLAIKLPDRSHPSYSPLRELLERSGFRLETSNRRWWLRDRHKTLNFLGQYWTTLNHHFDCDFTPNFEKNTTHLKRAEVACTAITDDSGNSLRLEVTAGAESGAHLQAAMTSGRHYIESDGAVYLADPERINQVQKVQQALSGDPSSPFMPASTHRISPARMAQVEALLETINPNFTPPAEWRRRSAPLRNLSVLKPAPLPEHASGLLRPYQAIGTAWMHHLHQHGLGGILADDMGLGKTVQALSLIASIISDRVKSDLNAVSCVICPATLLENWRREAARFYPEIRVFIHHGSRRLKTTHEFHRHDLIITSYGTLVRDRDLFSTLSFATIIADEAQHAKNRRSQNAQALFGLRSASRFVLTGTPVENSLDDLRTLIEFALPGAAPAPPQNTRGEERRWYDAQLSTLAAAYILRRAKLEVAKELPRKIEQSVFFRFEGAQRNLYERLKQTGQQEMDRMESSGASQGAVRMHVFKQLLRLRQACCDPRLIEPDRPASESAKLAAFRELLDEAMDAGHRMLVFSQFVSVLSLVREELEQSGIPYAYLDGKTRNRQGEVDRFNNDPEIPVFLISLRAGGTGLNLTGADTVVHYDPWWNPAVEAQATDRAHRIGQTRVVTSYRLIATDTVEERVIELQAGKRKMLEQVFDASDAASANLSLDDLKSILAPD